MKDRCKPKFIKLTEVGLEVGASVGLEVASSVGGKVVGDDVGGGGDVGDGVMRQSSTHDIVWQQASEL